VDEQSDQVQFHSYSSSKQPPIQYNNVPNAEFRLGGKSNRRFWLTFLFGFAFILACILGLLTLVLPSPAPPSLPGERLEKAIEGYFSALEQKDYKKAEDYFDPAGTIGVGDKSQQASSNVLSQLDLQKGPIISHDIVSITNFGNMASAKVEIKRNLSQREIASSGIGIQTSGHEQTTPSSTITNVIDSSHLVATPPRPDATPTDEPHDDGNQTHSQTYDVYLLLARVGRAWKISHIDTV
jgi:hypothetical protein